MQPGCMNLHFNVDYPDITDIILILMKRPSVNKVIVTFQEAKKNVDSEGKKILSFYSKCPKRLSFEKLQWF